MALANSVVVGNATVAETEQLWEAVQCSLSHERSFCWQLVAQSSADIAASIIAIGSILVALSVDAFSVHVVCHAIFPLFIAPMSGDVQA